MKKIIAVFLLISLLFSMDFNIKAGIGRVSDYFSYKGSDVYFNDIGIKQLYLLWVATTCKFNKNMKLELNIDYYNSLVHEKILNNSIIIDGITYINRSKWKNNNFRI
jgi:hypothetical protein